MLALCLILKMLEFALLLALKIEQAIASIIPLLSILAPLILMILEARIDFSTLLNLLILPSHWILLILILDSASSSDF